MISMVAAVCASAVSCVEQMPDVTEELLLGRCLSPTEATAPVDRTDGRTVAFTWAESKGALQYTIEIFEGAEDADPATVFAGTPTYTEVVKGSPLKKQLPSDKFYFARVKAQAPDTGVEDSKWVDFPYPIGTYEVKSNLWPEVALRTSGAVTLQWKEIDSDRVDHVRVYPNPDDASKAYKRYDVAASEGETVQTVVDGLASSVKYTFAVHFKSANRGEVVAWTRPSLDNPTVVTTSEQLCNALKDGAPVIKIAYSDTPYVGINATEADGSPKMNNGCMVNLTLGVSAEKSMYIYGEATEDGKLPEIIGGVLIPDGLSKLRVESVAFVGADNYTTTHPFVFASEASEAVEEISIVNCTVTGYRAGIFLDELATANIAKISLNSLYVSDIMGEGGNGFDIRSQIEVGSIDVTESTFSQGFRTFFRIDKAVVSSIVIRNNTFNNLCAIENGNNKGLFYIGTGKGLVVVPEFIFENNLLLNMNGNATRTVFASDDKGVPNKVANNWYYKLGAGFWKSEKVKVGDKEETINSEGKGKLTQTEGLAGGGQILSSDPCYDSAEGNLYVKNATVLEAKVGDPRWLQEYKPVVEDLTLAPVAAGKSWNLTDTKTFGKTVKTPVVRDGLRFIVGANPFKVSEKGLEFSAAGTVEALGVPSDAALAFMVDTPGTVILSTQKSNTGSAQGHLTVAYGPADGSKAVTAGSANVNEQKVKIALPNIVAGEPQIVYLYGCTSLILTALQWSDQIDSGASPVLGTPQVTITNESVDESFAGEVKLTWDEVSAAGSYKIYLNVPEGAEELPAAYAEVTSTEYVLPLNKLGTGKFSIQVQACPSADDMSREPSELSEPKEFKYLEILKPIAVETVWNHEYFKSLGEELGTGDITSETNGYSETAMTLGNLSYIFGGGKFKFGENEITVNETKNKVWRVQLGGTGTPGVKACIQFKVAGPGTIEVHAIASGDETEKNRVIAVALNDNEVGNLPLSLKRTPAPEVLTVSCPDAKEGDVINVYSKNKGVNVFEIKWTPSQVAATQEYTMTLSATAGVLSTNITGIPSSWKETDATWTAKDDSGKDEITFTGNVYYSKDTGKNVVWYFNKGKAETHVTATGLGKVKKVIVYPNSARKPEFLTCSYGDNDKTLAATEQVGVNSATITFDFAAAGIASDTFRIDYTEKGTNVEVGKVEIIYEK